MVSCAVLFRKAVARLVASPLFTAFAVMSLAAGVAVTTAVYSVVDDLLFKKFGARDPKTVAFVMAPRRGMVQRAGVEQDDLEAVAAVQKSFAVLSGSASSFANVVASRNSELLPIEIVEGHYFQVIGAAASAGRLIETADDQSASRVAVISETFWRTRYGADPEIARQKLSINGIPFDIIGVVTGLYAGIDVGGFGTQVWVPLSSSSALRNERFSPGFNEGIPLTAFGRLAPSVDVAAASVEIETIARQLDATRPLRPTGPGAPPRTRQWSVKSALDPSDADDGMRRAGVMLVILVGLVLVVACTNLANLVLARGTARQGELAIRMAMGASRGRLVWEQCVESLLLSGLGALAAYVMFVAISAWMTQDFAIIVPPMGRLTLSIRPEFNQDAVLVSAAALLLSLAVFGLEPAVHLARTLDIRTVLAVGATGIRPRVGRQRMIVRWQVAVAAGFFIVATMFIKATVDQARHDSGVDIGRLAVTTLNFQNRAVDDARARRAIGRILAEGGKEPSIERIAASTGLPFGIQPAYQAGMTLPGSDRVGAQAEPTALIAATPSIFPVLGIPIVKGRGFTDADGVAAPPVAVISELTAAQMFRQTDPIGQSLVLTIDKDITTVTIVGVSRDTDVRSLSAKRRPLIFIPLEQHFDKAVTISARASGRPATAVGALRNVVRAADPDMVVDLSGEGRALMSGAFEVLRSLGRGALYLGTFTLLLSMVGLFGVQSHVVMYRTREFGVRLSLGATARQIKTMVIRDGARPVFDGLVLGLWGGIAGRFMVRAYLDVEVAVFDPWMLVLAPIPIVAAALCACYLPAARASRVDPTTALRCE